MPSEDMLSATEAATENPEKEQVADKESVMDEPDEAIAENGQDDEAEKAAPVKTPSEEFVSAGEGTVSDGRGGSKKIFFLQQKKEDQPRWLKKMSDGLSSVGAAANETMHSMGAAANDTVSRLVKSTEKREEKKEAEKMEAEDKNEEEVVAKKDRVKAIVDAGRHSLDAASTRFSGLMASIKPAGKPEEASAEPPAPAAADASMTCVHIRGLLSFGASGHDLPHCELQWRTCPARKTSRTRSLYSRPRSLSLRSQSSPQSRVR